jgi:alkylated DNA repair dioxygenase AlkB
MPHQPGLFDAAPFPEGFVYRPDFLAPDEEQAVLSEIERLEFGEFRLRGVAARRRVVHFGWRYRPESTSLEAGPPIPPFLEPLRARGARLAGLPPADFVEALVMEYPPGAPIGWHRDAPMFGVIVGVSLLNACRFLLRRTDRDEKLELTLEPRSAYVLAGAVRSEWQHHIPPVKTLRYSITFRTLRPGRPRR